MKTKHITMLIVMLLSLAACQPRQKSPDHYRAVLEELQRDMVDKHLNYNLIQFQLQNLPVQGDLPLRTADNAELLLEDLVQQSPMLLFRYSEIHCNSCTDLVIQKMNWWYEQGMKNMAIIASYESFRYFTSFVRANQLKMPIYLLEQEEANGIFNTEIPPYLFLTDPSLRIEVPFVPIKEMEQGIDMYLEFVKEKLEESQELLVISQI